MNVRKAAFEVMRRHRLTTIFGNPGSTEITFLTDLPADFRFVLALHEGSVVGIATGVALAMGEPAFVNLHTAPGVGNAVNAIANARDSRAPLVIVVGQQDRRQIAFEPFLTGRALEPADPLAAGSPVPSAWRARSSRRPWRGWPSSWTGHRRSGWWSARAPTPPRDGRGSWRWPSGSAARPGRRRSAAAPASPRITRCSPGTYRGCEPGWRGCWPGSSSWWRSGRARCAPTCTTIRSRWCRRRRRWR